ncbi:hypothetical protein RRG08_010430 [Elysia crispata]|uniref:Uncharacterized protein n=1 Tax=Elysia crispata TaxID=231223 RepID=A0AAE1DWR0_9GAST|nr:hypothetical protein RRG08_010430 [Elysia crispata]
METGANAIADLTAKVKVCSIPATGGFPTWPSQDKRKKIKVMPGPPPGHFRPVFCSTAVGRQTGQAVLQTIERSASWHGKDSGEAHNMDPQSFSESHVTPTRTRLNKTWKDLLTGRGRKSVVTTTWMPQLSARVT